MELVVPKLSESLTIKGYSDKRTQLSRLIDMIRALLRHRRHCSLVIIDTFSTRAFWYCYVISLMCRIFKIPYLPVVHGGLFENRLRNSPSISRQVFSNSATNISPSLFLKEIFERNGYEIVYIPNFIDLNQYAYRKRTVLKPNLLWVRAFHKIYNPLMAIRVIKQLTEYFPEALLTMVGTDKDGSLAETQQLAKELGIESNVRFTGYLKKTDWIALSTQSDFFINTTTADNMPVSVMEAMALGLPIVSTNVGGIPYLLNDGINSYLVDNNDDQRMANCIRSLIAESKAGMHIASEARKQSEKLSWDKVGHQWISLIDKLSIKR